MKIKIIVDRQHLYKEETFRWGGIRGKFYRTAKEWREEWQENFGVSEENPYINCSCCGRKYNDNEYLYAGFFSGNTDEYMLKTLCKECAYRISNNVIEPEE